MNRGAIKRMVYDRGFGFITMSTGEDVYFHATALEDPQNFESLKQGQMMEFDIEETPRGLSAKNLRIILTI